MKECKCAYAVRRAGLVLEGLDHFRETDPGVEVRFAFGNEAVDLVAAVLRDVEEQCGVSLLSKILSQRQAGSLLLHETIGDCAWPAGK